MKVALIGPVYPFRGGIAHYTTVLSSELERRGHQVLLVSFERQYPKWLFPGRTDRDPSTAVLGAPGARYLLDPVNPVTWLRTVRAISAFHADSVVLQWWQAFWAPVWIVLGLAQRIAGRPLTIICHNVLAHERHAWDVLVARSVLALANRTIVQSESERADLLKLLPRKAVEVVPHPLYDMLAGEPISPQAARQRLGVNAGPVLLFFGFIRAYKGLRYLIEALPEVLKAFPSTQLLIAGEFWNDRQEYEALIAALQLREHVTIVDRYIPNEEVSLYFAAADLVTLPYTSATQSGVLQLALGFRRPVVSTRVGGLAEAVDEGCDVKLVEPGDASALARAIVGSLGSPQLSGPGKSRDLSKQRWEKLVYAVTQTD